MAEVFVSYASEDNEIAADVAAALMEEGWSVWWDTDIPAGALWRETIEREISAAACVLVLWSKNSVTSHWVKEEANFALNNDVLCPALIESDVQIPFGYTTIQSAKLWDWNGEPDHSGFAKLRAAVTTLAPTKPNPDPPLSQEDPIEVSRSAERWSNRSPRGDKQPSLANANADAGELSSPTSLRSPSNQFSVSPTPDYVESNTTDEIELASKVPREKAQARYIDLSLIRPFEWPVIAVFLAGISLLLVDQVLRFGFGSPLIWGFEVITILISMAMAGGIAMAIDRRIRFTSPYARQISKGFISRLARWLDVVIGLATTVTIGLSLFQKASNELEVGASFTFANLPIASVTYAYALIFGLIGLALIRQGYHSARRIRP